MIPHKTNPQPRRLRPDPPLDALGPPPQFFARRLVKPLLLRYGARLCAALGRADLDRRGGRDEDAKAAAADRGRVGVEARGREGFAERDEELVREVCVVEYLEGVSV